MDPLSLGVLGTLGDLGDLGRHRHRHHHHGGGRWRGRGGYGYGYYPYAYAPPPPPPGYCVRVVYPSGQTVVQTPAFMVYDDAATAARQWLAKRPETRADVVQCPAYGLYGLDSADASGDLPVAQQEGEPVYAIVAGAAWALGTLAAFAFGQPKIGYTMAGLGVVAGATVAIARARKRPA